MFETNIVLSLDGVCVGVCSYMCVHARACIYLWLIFLGWTQSETKPILFFFLFAFLLK